jgi:hypothetical protein
MTKTFKQQVEEILCKDCKKDSLVVVAFDCPKCIVHKQVARILAAHNAELDRIAAGMPRVKNPYRTPKDARLNVVPSAVPFVELEYRKAQNMIKTQRRACQAYIQAQKEVM